jgi:hypothetical protein
MLSKILSASRLSGQLWIKDSARHKATACVLELGALFSSLIAWADPALNQLNFSLFSVFLAGRSKTYDVLRELFKIIETARPCQLFF